MKKVSAKHVYLIIAILGVIVIILAILNMGQVEETRKLLEQRTILLKSEEQEIRVSLEEILDEFPATQINIIMRSSARGPSEKTYTGVPLKELLEQKLPGELEGASSVIARAADGYTIAYRASEVLEPDNIYLVYKEEDDWLKPREEGGNGPLMIIVIQDEFAQRWCKYLLEVTVE